MAVDWVPDFHASVKAARFAEIFTQNVLPSLKGLISTTKIEFVIPLLAKMDSLSHFKVLGLFPVKEDRSYLLPKEYVGIEPYLEGKFEKFNSNGGYEDNTAAVLNTFSHWTWHVSGHQYLVCDLQGVSRYGMTDLGVVGMEQVLASHKCNNLCDRLALSNPLADIAVHVPGHKIRHTTYNFQLEDGDIVRANDGRTPYFSFRDPIVH
ncbi:VWKA-like protein [Mya arenaria]|uniref:VWKA-like protein n=1 Tax=Mya arenaria TaxID=6604 RepID=A0ABY7ERI1_MYAAR|nr:VWKA-like protein [Mya arenaria]